MRKVIDSNQLRSPNLRDFLAHSPSNVAVIADYIAVEVYKKRSLENIYRSMSILSEYPQQVIILKSTNQVCGLNGKRAGLQKRLIDQRATKDFGTSYLRGLKAAQAGDQAAQHQLLALGSDADSQVARIQKDMQLFREGICETANSHTMEERGVIRGKQGFTPELIEKTVKSVLEICAMTFDRHPAVTSAPNYTDLLNTFVFRNALCTYLLALDWAANGGIQDVKPERLQNDLIDMSFAAYATFFDGLLTADGKCARIHSQARQWLKCVFECRLN